MSFGVCVNCQDVGEMEQAHIVPRSLGGTGTVSLCPTCHGIQHSMRDRQDISTLTRLGMERARARGVRFGRPNEIPDEVRERILRMRAEGVRVSHIARTLTEEGVPTARGGAVWRSSTIDRVLAQAEAMTVAA